ncbi:2OG-Fe(II) oxygenase [Rapidithrix thailandica]|uniref:2OG-Fe(II) oxygenase n=1 Tax=Rapidithrix thailandica TaxID=413964 RepID=A0AAW9S6K0_9BACT
MKLQQHTAKIWSIEGFLSSGECKKLIELSEQQGYEEAKVSMESGPKMMKGLRNNYRLLYEDPQMAHELWQKLAPFCPEVIEGWEAVGLNEVFRFYRYDIAQRFKRHIDGRFKRNSYEESRVTFMIYLNHDFEGGETKFDEVTIVPKEGDALCFIHEQKHESTPLKNGLKYVLRTDVMYRS